MNAGRVCLSITKKLLGPSIRRAINPYNYEETSL